MNVDACTRSPGPHPTLPLPLAQCWRAVILQHGQEHTTFLMRSPVHASAHTDAQACAQPQPAVRAPPQGRWLLGGQSGGIGMPSTCWRLRFWPANWWRVSSGELSSLSSSVLKYDYNEVDDEYELALDLNLDLDRRLVSLGPHNSDADAGAGVGAVHIVEPVLTSDAPPTLRLSHRLIVCAKRRRTMPAVVGGSSCASLRVCSSPRSLSRPASLMRPRCPSTVTVAVPPRAPASTALTLRARAQSITDITERRSGGRGVADSEETS